MQSRRRSKRSLSLNDRLKMFADQLKSKAVKLRPGPERDALLKRARIADTTANLNDWMSSPGLQPPK
jgi:hypothetical protein